MPRDKLYYAEYYQKHRSESHVCELCGGKYNFSNKSHHLASQKHKRMVDFAFKMKDKILSSISI